MLTAFTAGLLLITISELGDKTFFIAVVLSTRYPRWPVFGGVVAALATMTLLSVLLGRVATIFPPQAIKLAEIVLFIGFGLKLLYDGGWEWVQQRWQQFQTSVAQRDTNPETSASLTCSHEEAEAIAAVTQAETSLKLEPTVLGVLLKAFGLTFLAEWGDRTQFATIALAAGSPSPVGVTIGAIFGHTLCAAIAVIGGRMIACHLSERMLLVLGGTLFIVFGVLAALDPLVSIVG